MAGLAVLGDPWLQAVREQRWETDSQSNHHPHCILIPPTNNESPIIVLPLASHTCTSLYRPGAVDMLDQGILERGQQGMKLENLESKEGPRRPPVAQAEPRFTEEGWV